jgi:hypothetical protein
MSDFSGFKKCFGLLIVTLITLSFLSSALIATANLNMPLIVSPSKGTVGTKVDLYSEGFAPKTLVSLYLGASITPFLTVITSPEGILNSTFNVPLSATGTYVITAKDASGNTACGIFSLLPEGTEESNTPTAEPTITPNPTATPYYLNQKITVYVDASTATVGSPVNIKGKLTANEVPIPNEPVTLSYVVLGSRSDWIPIGSVITDINGEYSFQWVNNVSGTFLILADWWKAPYGASADTKISILPAENPPLFLVESNSTVTALTYNSTSSYLSFSVSGPDGSFGYVNVTIAKSLASNPEYIKVFVDGEPANFTVASIGDSWLLYFSYHHSIHSVLVELASSPDTTDGAISNYFGAGAVAVGILVSAALLLFTFKGKRKTHN